MSKMPVQNVSKLQPASGKGNSLRVTIPSFIVGQFQLERGDTLLWKIEAVNGEEKITAVPVDLVEEHFETKKSDD